MQTWPARLAQDAWSTAKLPGDVAQGNVQMWGADGHTNPEVINRATDLGGMVIGGGLPMAERGAVGMAGGKLSLPMDEASRLARAKEQGFTIDAFKGGQPYDWETLPVRNGLGKIIEGTENRVPQELTKMKDAAFFSNNPEVANRFAAPFEHGAVWPTKLKMENPLVIDAGGHHAANFQFESIANKAGTLDKLNAFKQALLPDSKYDGVILKNTKDEGTVYIPKSGDQVRSRFAAFDPTNVGGGLLAGYGGVFFSPAFGPPKQDDPMITALLNGSGT